MSDRRREVGIPAIILLLSIGFAAGNLITAVDPEKIFGAAFTPLVSIAVAIILFDGGLDLSHGNLLGDDRTVVHRLRSLGVAITWLGGAVFAGLLLGLSSKAAIMLGAILIVSGPTVVTPVLDAARPGKRLTAILGFEGNDGRPDRCDGRRRRLPLSPSEPQARNRRRRGPASSDEFGIGVAVYGIDMATRGGERMIAVMKR